ncbi:(2Fe-2S)-binding protein [Thiocapsa imhoffii]|uniref:(2Fe-2S)-binding protein n=1 Tax=Thiocapsa imhoffii TaxID=382777 RepID=A0A9X0WJ64_9GAMM|nr:Rieske 2Fe-2S domain-containing protein [Thiocapsa imhoffii]MBK1645706.1 (2Fe-2S)-binding protein [Thiocapsa imhoffii]
MSSSSPPQTLSALERRKLLVCPSADLKEHQHRIIPIRFKQAPQSAIVLRFGGQVYAYLNQCVHMVRRLDCMHDGIFDTDQDSLRCSMHGIVYDPTTGASKSVLCAGERLEALRTLEIDGQIYLTDKRVRHPT